MAKHTVMVKQVWLAALIAIATVGCSSQLNPKVKRDIDHQLRAKRGHIEACYRSLVKKADKSAPKPTGKLSLSFDVLTSGAIVAIEVKDSQLADQALHACVMAQAKAIKLAHKPDRPLKVHYPVDFAVVR
jgi:hypothetical protein